MESNGREQDALEHGVVDSFRSDEGAIVQTGVTQALKHDPKKGENGIDSNVVKSAMGGWVLGVTRGPDSEPAVLKLNKKKG